ncbi:hypothetical protein K435DRAFT_856699 [Dendrothele bispora CBS 962.96]|uniref:GH16 domain-containing protein n=1 Tax=Dendrothele bispora (strain CBS 962.96) TaxID=1314807 RepID=A0A4S8M7Q1_DENBC|nr:hypothetical protein K435DRAFT_856699 [Dendrothele bispora CBS 962.96]
MCSVHRLPFIWRFVLFFLLFSTIQDKRRPGARPESKRLVLCLATRGMSMNTWRLPSSTGSTFFADWDNKILFLGGIRSYVNKSFALNGLAYVQDGLVFMKGDDTTWLANGEFRSSVRISSISQYNTGLLILDINRAPWGCAIWPAWWTVGGCRWPLAKLILIFSREFTTVHITKLYGIHTGPGCFLTPESNFTSAVVFAHRAQPSYFFGDINKGTAKIIPTMTTQSLPAQVAAFKNVQWHRASYGEDFNLQGGGVFAMKWDENGIVVWSFFRAAVPADIIRSTPNPYTMGFTTGSSCISNLGGW